MSYREIHDAQVEKYGQATADKNMTAWMARLCSAHCEGASMSAELTKGQRVCLERGYHDDEEFIDPKSGGFTRCKDCGRDVDREESEEW